jgi:hypothetical protein
MNAQVRCRDCGNVLTHVCGESTKSALKRLFEFKLQCLPVKLMKSLAKDTGYEKGDEVAPFFSESFLYNLLGKDDARTILAVLNNFIRAMGIDPTMSLWPERGCQHRFVTIIAKGEQSRFTQAEWCESCGAVRRYDDVVGKMGEWMTPANAEQVVKLKKTSSRKGKKR